MLKNIPKKKIIINTLSFIIIIVFSTVSNHYFKKLKIIPGKIWNDTMNRNYNTTYIIPEKVKKQKTNRIAVRRLQPEYNKWNISINKRLQMTNSRQISIFDDTDYVKNKYVELYKYLNENMKKNEVLYVDSRSYLPYTVAYVKGNTFEINYKKAFGYSLSAMKRTKEIPFNGYVFTKTFNEATVRNENTILRTFNNSALQRHKDFIFKKRFGNINLYYYKGGENFPFEDPEKIMDYKSENKEPEDNKSKYKSLLLKTLEII